MTNDNNWELVIINGHFHYAIFYSILNLAWGGRLGWNATVWMSLLFL